MARLIQSNRPSSRVDFFTVQPYREKLAQASAALNEGAKHLGTLNEAKKEARTEIDRLHTVEENLFKKIVDLEREAKVVQDQLAEEKEKNIVLAELTKKALKEQEESIKKERAALEAEVVSVRAALDAEVATKLSTLQTSIGELSKEIKHLEERRAKAGTSLDGVREAIQAKLLEFEAEQASMQSALSLARESHEKELTAIDLKKASLEATLKVVIEELGQAGILANLHDAIGQAESEGAKAKQRIEDEIQTLTSSRSLLEDKHKEIEKDIERSHAILEKRNAELVATLEALKQDKEAELAILEEKSGALSKKIVSLESDVLTVRGEFEGEMKKKEVLTASLKREVSEGKEVIVAIQSEIETLSEHLGGLVAVQNDLKLFIDKEHNAREKYLEAQKELTDAEKEKAKAEKITKDAKQELATEQNELQKSKESMTDLFNKLSGYAYDIHLAVGYLNKQLSKYGVPVEYESPVKKVEKQIKKVLF